MSVQYYIAFAMRGVGHFRRGRVGSKEECKAKAKGVQVIVVNSKDGRTLNSQ